MSIFSKEKRRLNGLYLNMGWQSFLSQREAPLIAAIAILIPGWIMMLYPISGYVSQGLNLILGLISLPLIIRVRKPGQYSFRYGILFLVSVIAYHAFGMRVFALLIFGSSVFLLVEAFYGKIGFLPLIWILLLSPALEYLSDVFTFPIRLQLGDWAGMVMELAQLPITVRGNVFHLADSSFVIDPSCVGLSSTLTALLLTVVFMSQVEYEKKNTYALLLVVLLMGAAFLLSILGSFVRIVTLVLMRSFPKTLSHELIGIFSLIFYVLIPIYFLIRYSSRHVLPGSNLSIISPRPWKKVPVFFLITCTLIIVSLRWETVVNPIDTSHYNSWEIAGMEKDYLPNRVIKFSNEELLIYMKAPRAMWASDHAPNICWRSSGYKFIEVERESLGEKIYYKAKLKKGEKILHTAWWFENGTIHTHRQLTWRLNMLKGDKPYYMVNLTCENEESLYKYCQQYLQKPLVPK